jgi:predicted ester cyclase
MDRGDVEKFIVRWTQEGIADGRLDIFDDLVAKNVVDRSAPATSQGVESFKGRAAAIRAAFSEIDIRIEDLIVEGNAIAWHWALTGTHIGTFAAVAPTGRRITIHGVNLQRIEGTKVVEHWTIVDVFAAAQALRA